MFGASIGSVCNVSRRWKAWKRHYDICKRGENTMKSKLAAIKIMCKPPWTPCNRRKGTFVFKRRAALAWAHVLPKEKAIHHPLHQAILARPRTPEGRNHSEVRIVLLHRERPLWQENPAIHRTIFTSSIRQVLHQGFFWLSRHFYFDIGIYNARYHEQSRLGERTDGRLVAGEIRETNLLVSL